MYQVKKVYKGKRDTSNKETGEEHLKKRAW